MDQLAREEYSLKKDREEAARSMLEEGIGIATICKCTGLGEKEVEALKSRHKK